MGPRGKTTNWSEQILRQRPNQILLGDCLSVMITIPDNSIDMLLCGPPYKTTECEWDIAFDIDNWWVQVKRIMKPKTAIVVFGSQPFTSRMIMSNMPWFKYEWIWVKNLGANFVHSKNKPIKIHENIMVFSSGVCNHETCTKNRMVYYPQGLKTYPLHRSQAHKGSNVCFAERKSHFQGTKIVTEHSYPKSVLPYKVVPSKTHPSEKPVPLLEYLIKTYSIPGNIVLDCFCGSGSTLAAAYNTDRRYIGIDKEPEFYEMSRTRLEKLERQIRL